MKPSLGTFVIYSAVIVLCAFVLLLILISPSGFTEGKSVYQGF